MHLNHLLRAGCSLRGQPSAVTSSNMAPAGTDPSRRALCPPGTATPLAIAHPGAATQSGARDGGFTLIELSIAMAIFSLVLVGVFGMINTMVHAQTSAQASASISDTAGLTQQQLDMSVRQGALYSVYTTAGTWVAPSTCGSACAASAFIVLNQSDGAGDQVCVEWEITTNPSALGRLSWAPGALRPTANPAIVADLSSGSFSVTTPSGGLSAVTYTVAIAGPPSKGTTVPALNLTDTVVAPNRTTGTC